MNYPAASGHGHRAGSLSFARLLAGEEKRLPRFALVTTVGDALVTVEFGRPDWPDGAIINRGDEPDLRVVGQLAADDSEHGFDVLVVVET